jgi:hypothetical protein
MELNVVRYVMKSCRIVGSIKILAQNNIYNVLLKERQIKQQIYRIIYHY